MELPATEAKKAEGSKCEEGKTVGAVWDTMRCLLNTPVKMFGRKLRAYKRGTEGEIQAGDTALLSVSSKSHAAG